ncbi:hypothetical protein BY996DRAFT_6571474 [Phakopsora pachyrhizi]|nr:hypothetical protein BY996DRAFT_6571474 [Phakopsora pachyrhizi]
MKGGPEYGANWRRGITHAQIDVGGIGGSAAGWLDHLGIGRYGAEAGDEGTIDHMRGQMQQDLMDRKEREWNKEGSESSGQIQRRKAGVGDQIEQGWALTELEYGKMDELGRRRDQGDGQRVLQTSDKGHEGYN